MLSFYDIAVTNWLEKYGSVIATVHHINYLLSRGVITNDEAEAYFYILFNN